MVEFDRERWGAALTRSWTSQQALAEWRRWFRKRSTRGEVMKIVVIGGTGLIGSKVVEKLKQKGHEVIAAAPNTGVNTITGEGLADALAGAQVVVDVANSPSFEDQAAMDFFQTAGKNLTAAEEAAGIKHHVALSVVGTVVCRTAVIFALNLSKRSSSRARQFHTRLSTPPSSSSSFGRSPSPRPRATRCACRLCCSSRWRQTTWRARSPRQRLPSR